MSWGRTTSGGRAQADVAIAACEGPVAVDCALLSPGLVGGRGEGAGARGAGGGGRGQACHRAVSSGPPASGAASSPAPRRPPTPIQCAPRGPSRHAHLRPLCDGWGICTISQSRLK